MKNRRLMKVAVYLIMILIISCTASRDIKKSFFFIQITDPQFGFISNNKGINEETILYEKAVSKINLMEPAFVVITGDLVNDKSNKTQWDEFRRITRLIKPGIKVSILPGNHDIGQNPEVKDLEFYKSMFGNDRFSFKQKKVSFIGFNSSLIKAGTPVLVDEQYDWLQRELVRNKGAQQTILFCHHPFFIKDPAESENYSNIRPEIRKKYLDLFTQYGVDALFSGHLHNNASGKYSETEFITTSAVGKKLADAPSGFRVIYIEGDKIRHEYLPLN
jgi:3',5'-cyclic AMP phosphodiesterase CpdA